MVICELTPDTERQLSSAFEAASIIACDSEGVDLGRLGVISIVQLATPEQCFIIDVLGKNADNPLIMWLRGVLENENVTKIIHDCHMDADALFHHLGIQLTKVHDTACWHHAITGTPDQNLNDVLIQNRLQPNTVRDSRVYETNHAFWATRPMTQQMIQWAAGDLLALSELRERQVQKASDIVAQKARDGSRTSVEFCRSANVSTFKVGRNIGRFIGPRGSAIRQLQTTTRTLIYGKGKRGDNQFVVYFHDDNGHARVLRAAQTC